MSETVSIIFWALALIAVFMLTTRINAWRTGRAAFTLIKELKAREAFDPVTAVPLHDVKKDLLRVGLRSFRPEALRMLLVDEVVGMTHDGKYYLKGRNKFSSQLS